MCVRVCVRALLLACKCMCICMPVRVQLHLSACSQPSAQDRNVKIKPRCLKGTLGLTEQPKQAVRTHMHAGLNMADLFSVLGLYAAFRVGTAVKLLPCSWNEETSQGRLPAIYCCCLWHTCLALWGQHDQLSHACQRPYVLLCFLSW